MPEFQPMTTYITTDGLGNTWSTAPGFTTTSTTMIPVNFLMPVTFPDYSDGGAFIANYPIIGPQAEARRREAFARAEADRIERSRFRRESVAAATARSRELLVNWLEAEQRASFEAHGWFDVLGSSGRRWRINPGQVGNVSLMRSDEGNVPEATYCAHPPGVPVHDAHLVQALVIASDEEAFIRVANRIDRW